MIEVDIKSLTMDAVVAGDKMTSSNKQDRPLVKVEDMEEDTICGIWFYKPQWLQPWATARMFLCLYCATGVIQGTTFTYLIGIMTTLEKRYAFKSKTSGIIVMIDEILPGVIGGLVGYFGGKTHRPRLMFIGMFLSVLCCFISAFPYALYGTSEQLAAHSVFNTTGSEKENNICKSVNSEICMTDEREESKTAVSLLVFGHFLKGFGNIAFFAIGTSYMDDAAKRKNTPLYFAISTSLRYFGPVLGFLLASACLKLYENPMVDPGFGPDDPRWIGAWWLGYVLQGIVLLIFSLPLLVFPRRLPSHRKQLTKDLNEETFKEHIVGYFQGLKRLLTNPMYMSFIISIATVGFGGAGFLMILPKYMENQFQVSASLSNLISGPPAIFTMQIAIIIGGLAIWKWRPSIKTLIIINASTYFLQAVALLALMIPSCDDPYERYTVTESRQLQLTNMCNTDCNCVTDVLTPVCAPNGVSYFSPCFAGCNSSFTENDVQHYGNCSCLFSATDGDFELSTSIENGYCPDSNCYDKLLVYIIFIFLSTALTSLLTTTVDLFILRSVEPVDKSMSCGMFEGFLSLFALCPSALVYGALMDKSCLIWESSCGETGNCWHYDLNLFKKLVFGLTAVANFASILAHVAMYHFSPMCKDFYVDNDLPSDNETKINGKDRKNILNSKYCED